MLQLVRLAAVGLLLLHSTYAFPNISLTISSLQIPLDGHGGHVIQRPLEVVWQPMPDAEWFGIFTVIPPKKGTEGPSPIARISPSDHPGGYFRTNISFLPEKYPKGWNKGSQEKPVSGDACMLYWVAAYNKENEVLESDCIKIRPTWMGDHRKQLETLALGDLFIPGTHNSATFNRAIMQHTGEVIGQYVLTQDVDIWGQLVFGIRYLDLHIRHYPGSKTTSNEPATQDDERYRKLVNVDAVSEILNEIKEYLKKAGSEIIILDINEFPPGFEGHPSNHHQFVALLNATLAEFVIPFSSINYSSTLAEVWKTGKNLIVTYNNQETTKEYEWLWGPIPRMWAEKQSPEDLKEFLQECVDDAKTSNRTTFWAAMAALKPTPIDFMFGGASSLRELASMVNRELARWYLNDWWRYTSIVATDFFLGNNIIDTAVKACVDKAIAQSAVEEG